MLYPTPDEVYGCHGNRGTGGVITKGWVPARKVRESKLMIGTGCFCFR